MIVKPLKFEWIVSDEVQFKVWQDPMHILCEKYYSQGKIPPLNERVTLLRKAGYPEEKLKKLIKNHLQWKKDAEKNQIVLDNTFMKFNIKPTKKKVFKAVKKSSIVIRE
jgi:hypothetical protein